MSVHSRKGRCAVLLRSNVEAVFDAVSLRAVYDPGEGLAAAVFGAAAAGFLPLTLLLRATLVVGTVFV